MIEAAPRVVPHRQHDYILGDWEVRRAGDRVATARFQLAADGRAILHTWTPATAGGHAGVAILSYCEGEQNWQYFWAGNSGDPVHYRGEQQRPGHIAYRRRTTRNGEEGLSRFGFELLANGHIRELGEASWDGGATWAVEYDLLLTRPGV
ncbi:hypothetical protein [Phenylobacterium sp.]|jgi:hypothetical protein|uniref:hypothetical protein n=1 Tax=Phenylobacterium sp. TaxID=1871053 RepID=UPI0037845F64